MRNGKLVHKVTHDAGGESIYATHFPPVTNPHPDTVTYTGFPRNTNPSDFHNACWDTVAPCLDSRLDWKIMAQSRFSWDTTSTTRISTLEKILIEHVMATPVKFGGNTYLPQVPIPENVNITKIYVSEATLPKEKCRS